jgi:AAA domain/Protein kinase domain
MSRTDSRVARQIIGGRYRIFDEPARPGGTADVHRALDIDTGDVVALKMYRSQAHPSKYIQEFFQRESLSLEELKHPNIVDMRDAGFDDERQQHYLVLEWLADNLPSWLNARPATGWDDFCDQVVIPVLNAIVFAHGRRILHRDIKPSNILMTADGMPKLADFGIAKLLTHLQLGVTLNTFRSELYSPPEQRFEVFDERGDLFAFGMTILRCLIPDSLALTHGNLPEAIRAADVPTEAERFVGRLVALEPDARFESSSIAWSELAIVMKRRPAAPVSRPALHIVLTATALRPVQSHLQRLGIAQDANGFVREDISDQVAIDYAHKGGAGFPQEESYRLIGSRFSYVAVPARDDAGVLAIVAAYESPPSLLEDQRDQALVVPLDVVFGKPRFPVIATQVVDILRQQVLEHHQARRLERERLAEKQLLDKWSDVLDAKLRLGRLREVPLSFKFREIRGREVVFILDKPLANQDEGAELLQQIRRVAVPGGWIGGPLIEVFHDRVLLLATFGEPHLLPKAGRLQLDRDLSELAIRRQRNALDEVRFERAARPELAALLIHPDRARVPTDPGTLEFVTNDLDEPKMKAVGAALGSADLITVQGPPGTGKTTFIGELVCQIRKRQPHAQILVSAQTHVAVDNAIDRMIQLDPHLKVVRIGPTQKIGGGGIDQTVDVQLQRWRSEVRQRAPRFFDEWARLKDIPAVVLRALNEVSDLQEAQAGLGAYDDELDRLRVLEMRFMDRLTDPSGSGTTSPQVAIQESGLELLTSTTIDVDISLEDALASVEERLQVRTKERQGLEASRDKHLHAACKAIGINPEGQHVDTLLEAVRRAVPRDEDVVMYRHLKSLQGEWLRRFGGPEFEAPLLSEAHVIAGTCVGIAAARAADGLVFDVVILDEASKAAPTEALVPMGRGKSWILVGDPKQLPPYVDSVLTNTSALDDVGLDLSDLKETLFDRLLEGLPAANKIDLTVQHRMVSSIGQLISDCFYDGILSSSRQEGSFASLQHVLQRPVTWLSTSRLRNRREQKRGTSFVNPEEARRIRTWLARLHFYAKARDERVDAAVISGYAAQRELLERELASDLSTWSPHLKLTVHSVDSFQGQERDLLVYSVTRSNQEGILGFLAAQERLNVALSRGRDGLVIFGDSDHCQGATASDNPFLCVLDHIRKHPDCCALSRNPPVDGRPGVTRRVGAREWHVDGRAA